MRCAETAAAGPSELRPLARLYSRTYDQEQTPMSASVPRYSFLTHVKLGMRSAAVGHTWLSVAKCSTSP